MEPAVSQASAWGGPQFFRRARGFNVEMYHAAKKIPDQLKYASRKGIPFVWFAEEDGTHQVKNMSSGEQTKTDPQSWVLPEGYARHEAA